MTLYRGWDRIICCASGPSFTPQQAAMVTAAHGHGWRVMVCNNQYRTVPTADVLYATDGAWWDVHLAEVLRTFHGELWTQDRAAADRRALYLVHSVTGDYLPDDPTMITHGGNGGFQMLSLAARFGGKQIILCGYDMRREGTRNHNHADHKAPLSNGQPSGWVKHYTRLASDLKAAGVDVINCSVSALQCFRCEPLEDALGMVTV